MQAGQLILVRTDPATQFTGALAQNAAATVNLAMNFTGPAGDGYVDPGLGAGKTLKARLRSILIQSRENLDWEVWLWGKNTFNASATDPAQNFPFGFVALAGSGAKQIAGAGLYTYFVSGVDVPYLDLDVSGQLHLMLVNRAGAGKSAGAAGAVGIQLAFENTAQGS